MREFKISEAKCLGMAIKTKCFNSCRYVFSKLVMHVVNLFECWSVLTAVGTFLV